MNHNTNFITAHGCRERADRFAPAAVSGSKRSRKFASFVCGIRTVYGVKVKK